MFKIEDDIIHLTRGDSATIELVIDDYTFNKGDKIEFRVYNEKALDKLPLLTKTIIVEEESESVDIELTSEETTICDMTNQVIKLWYEIELNDDTTVIGYDEDGPKRLLLYPEGAEDNAE